MLNNIYKYTSLRLDFFDNLLIRASQKYALNDPFELRPSYKNNSKNVSKLVEGNYFDYAVISLSETNNNLLMWSHYADQHKGIVIEFDKTKELFDSYTTFKSIATGPDSDRLVINEIETRKRESIRAGKIQRVRYSSKRPSIKKFDSILEHFLVKSEEWIYEKEHRIILPLIRADRVIVSGKYLERIEDTLYEGNELDKLEKQNGYYDIDIKSALEIDGQRYINDIIFSDYSDLTIEEQQNGFIEAEHSEYLREISEDPKTIFLYKVPEKSIKAIYFGCRSSLSDQDLVISKIKSNPKLSHVKLYRASPSNERFELEFKMLKG